MLGDSILYLLTYDMKKKKFDFYTVLSLKDMESILLTDEHIDEIQKQFRKHIRNLSSKDLEIEKEKLCYLIENENQRISSSVNKINILHFPNNGRASFRRQVSFFICRHLKVTSINHFYILYNYTY